MAVKVCQDTVTDYYNDPRVIDHYRKATANVGLWVSEELLFRRLFQTNDRILELGCGTGRISIGLAEIGYRHLIGIELAREIVKEARRIAKALDLGIPFRYGDARNLKFEDDLFDGAIFGFNGLMQIPGRDQRRLALKEIHRVVRPGAALVFTSHDRQVSTHRQFWREEADRWGSGSQLEELVDFGDRYEDTPLGTLFIHVPTTEEIREDLQSTGWAHEWDAMRSSIARENPVTQAFSDDCRFWVARKPARA